MNSVQVPCVRGLLLCDYQFEAEKGKVDLYGLFNTIRPAGGYPYSPREFMAFAQLVDAEGRVQVYVEVRAAETDESVRISDTFVIDFPTRQTVVSAAIRMERLSFGCTSFPWVDPRSHG
jgi:hypothetical protein